MVIMSMSMIVPYFFDIEFFCVLLFYIRHFHFIIFTARFQYRFDLRYRNGREIFTEQEEAGKEQPEGTEVETDLPDAGAVVGTPARW